MTPRRREGRRPRRASARPRRGRPAWLIPAAILLFLLALGGLAVFGPGPAPAPGVSVIVPRGSGVGGVASALSRAKAVRTGALFVAAAELSGQGRRLQAGEYAIPAHASIFEVLRLIAGGHVVRHFVTIPEGFTSAAAAAVLADADELEGPAPAPPEGVLLPETYEVQRGETRAHVLARMRAAREALLTRLWAHRAPGLPYRSPLDAVILASVVEKETALPAERPHVAAVFLNRLRAGMRLGSDPTVIYGLTQGRPLGHGLTVGELASPSPYNTYRVTGLPPTPIDNPGRASLEAALQPAVSNDLYFVANGTGGHAFAATLAQHDLNVARWRQIERDRKSAP